MLTAVMLMVVSQSSVTAPPEPVRAVPASVSEPPEVRAFATFVGEHLLSLGIDRVGSGRLFNEALPTFNRGLLELRPVPSQPVPGVLRPSEARSMQVAFALPE